MLGSSITVIKREGHCKDRKKKENKFCKEYRSIKRKVQDDGLIFAKGEKENLNDEHGMAYCAYTLLEQYLNRGKVFGIYRHYDKVKDTP